MAVLAWPIMQHLDQGAVRVSKIRGCEKARRAPEEISSVPGKPKLSLAPFRAWHICGAEEQRAAPRFTW